MLGPVPTVPASLGDRRVALVHDWLVSTRGGESVLASLCRLFPAAPIFTLVHDASRMPTVIAGRAGGKLNSGRFLDLSGNDWSQLLVTLCHAMGVTDVDKVGELPMKTGPIASLLT